MALVEVASFKASKAFFSNTVSVAFNKALDDLKETDGCLCVYHGSELDDKTRRFVIVVRDSDKPNAGTNKLAISSTLEVELNKLGISSADDLFTDLFAFDADPITRFDAPLPELWYGRIREGYGLADVQVFIKTFFEKLEQEDNELCGLTIDDLPTWIMGLSGHGRSNVFVVGWESNEECKTFLALEGFRKHLKDAEKLLQFERKFLSLVKA